MSVSIHVSDNLSAWFEEIIYKIKTVVMLPTDDLIKLGDYPDRKNLAVDVFTIGEKFLDPQSYKNGEVYKLLMAKSFIVVTNIDLEILEREFKKWGAENFPEQKEKEKEEEEEEKKKKKEKGKEKKEKKEKENEEKEKKQKKKEQKENDEYNRGNFVVECLFIIEVFRRKTWGYTNYPPDKLGSIGLLLKAQRDMLVCGNQLPFTVLKDLYNLAFHTNAATPEGNFFKVCTKFFEECLFISNHSQIQLESIIAGPDIEDFIHLLRKCHEPMSERQPPEIYSSKFKAMKNATYLETAGMTLTSPSDETDDPISVCSLSYSDGVLVIPKFTLNEMSTHVFINFIAYEKRHYPNDTFIIDYVHFIGRLIDKPRDVNLLVRNGILDNHLPKSKKVSQLFNKIIEESPLNAREYYYHGISESVNTFCDIPWHRWKATLRNNYCSEPWMIVSTAAAIFLLLLTLLQTIFTIISTVR